MDKLFVRWDKAHGKWDNPPHGGMKKYGHYNKIGRASCRERV